MHDSQENKFDDFWFSTRGTEIDYELEGLEEDSTSDEVDFDDMSDDLAV